MKLVRDLILHEEREEDDFIICNLFEDIEKHVDIHSEEIRRVSQVQVELRWATTDILKGMLK